MKDSVHFNFQKKMTRAKSMRLCDQFLMVLMKLRLNLEFIHLANLFCMSPSDAGLLFRNWMNYIFFRFGSDPIWPHRDTIIDNMPQKFRKDFPTTLVILDGTELKIERPSSLRSRRDAQPLNIMRYTLCNVLSNLFIILKFIV